MGVVLSVLRNFRVRISVRVSVWVRVKDEAETSCLRGVLGEVYTVCTTAGVT